MELSVDIVTVTLNPAIDQTVFLDRFRAGQVNRVRGDQSQAGGKGVNVSSMLGQYGISTTATGFLGQDNPLLFDTLFHRLPVQDEFIRIPGTTRTGIKIVDEGTRETTDLNFPGLTPTAAEIEKFERKMSELVRPGRWFVLAGSLPDGMTHGHFAKIMALLQCGGARVAADTSGEALAAAIDGGVELVKPNEQELAGYLGHALPDLPSRVAAARKVQREKVPRIILSLGADGALFVTADATLLASAPPVSLVSTVGAGDALLAGYLAGLSTGLAPDDCARLATVFAWSSLENVSRTLPAAETIRKRLPMVFLQSL